MLTLESCIGNVCHSSLNELSYLAGNIYSSKLSSVHAR
jgi:hypothetical protein